MKDGGAGYSGTPLAKKLGIEAGARVLVLSAPAGYREWLAPVPPGVRFGSRWAASTDLVHCFVTRRRDLLEILEAARPRLKPDGTMWVSWPKKAARVATDVTEDTIREIALPLGFVDIKVCAVNEVWSGLKLVIRKALRTTT